MPRTALPWLYVDITTFDANFQLSNFSSSRGRLSLLTYRNNNKMFRPTFYFIFIRLVLFISWLKLKLTRKNHERKKSSRDDRKENVPLHKHSIVWKFFDTASLSIRFDRLICRPSTVSTIKLFAIFR